jgi:hypothetical protein
MSHSAIERYDSEGNAALLSEEQNLTTPHLSPDAGMRLSAHPRSLSHSTRRLTAQAYGNDHFAARAAHQAHAEMLIEVFHGAAPSFRQFHSQGIAGMYGQAGQQLIRGFRR